MMMTQSYQGGSGFDAFNRPHHRNMANAAYYERAAPYTLYEPRHELRQEYAGRIPTHTAIQEPDEPLTAGGQARRRIAVACGRCRRRKIKCSGDPGDGTGCQACRSSGARLDDCNFCRMNSQSLEVIPSETNITGTRPYNIEASASEMSNGATRYPPQHRPSLPILQTRTTWPSEYDNQYESSPVDSYTYGSASAPRHDSMSSTYASADNYRAYSTSAPLSAPLSSPFYESGTYSFGSLQASVPGHAGGSRLPSVSAENMSALNMGSLHSSLPAHTPLERRLPPVVPPYSISYQQRQPYSQGCPEPRPIDPATANFRPYVNGVHSRHAMPWSVESNSSRSNVPGTHESNYASTSPSQHQITSSMPATTATMADPILGYQFQPPTSTYSPEPSPSVAPTLAEPFPSTTTSAMLPPAHTTSLRYAVSHAFLPAISAPYDEPGASSSRLPEIHAHAPVASLYSYSSETSERSSSDATVRDNTGRDDMSQTGETSGSDATYNGYSPSRHTMQPQHSASYDGLRRQSEYDHRRASTGPGHRSSARSLNERY